MASRALIVSGGGARGAYAVGAVDYMVRTLGLEFDVVAGTSTGGLIAPLVVTDDVETLLEIYSSVTTDDIVRRRPLGEALFKSDSVFRVEPLARLIDSFLTPARTEAILASPRRLFLCTVSLQSGETVYFHAGPEAVAEAPEHLERITDRDTLLRATLATACIPVFMPPQRIPFDASPVRQYVDGGVREVAPLKIAIDNGATELYVVLLSPADAGQKRRPVESLLEILEETIGLFGREVMLNDVRTAQTYSAALTYLDAVRRRAREHLGLDEAQLRDLFAPPGVPDPFAGRKPVTIHLIRPETKADVPTDALTFDPAVMRGMIDRGREKAREVLGPAPRPV